MVAKVPWVLLVIAVGLLVWAALSMLVQGETWQTEDALVVVEPERDLGEWTLGTHTLELRVHNPAGKPRRILGLPHG